MNPIRRRGFESHLLKHSNNIFEEEGREGWRTTAVGSPAGDGGGAIQLWAER